MELSEIIIFEKYKKLILLSFFIFGIHYSGNCQIDLSDQPYKIENTSFNRDSAFYIPLVFDYLYTYDEDGEVISFNVYQVAEDFFSLERIYEYQDGDLLFSKSNYYNLEQDITRSNESTYSYHDSCLVLKVATEERTGYATQVITKYDSTSCKIVLEDKNIDHSGGSDFGPSDRYEWDYYENKKEQRRYRYNSSAEEYLILRKELTYYDDLDRQEAIVTEVLGSIKTDSTHFSYAFGEEYDFTSLEESFRFINGSNGELYKTKKTELKGDSILLNVLELNIDGSVYYTDSIVYINHYDDQDLLIKIEFYKKTKFDTWDEPRHYANTTTFEFDCEGRLVKYVFDARNFLRIYKYFYEEEITCEEQEYEEVNKSITVFPNPTYYYIDIQGDLIKQEGTKVELFDMKGTNIPVTYNDFSTDKIRIFLEHLYTGVYVVRVTNRDQSSVEVFIKK